MSTSNLTAKYRPQTFTDVAGQNAIKAILSRAAEKDKIAPAYLFSGTRGVGKTTIARIFAKALNCVNAPTGEPCNECSNCKQITAGVAVDVIEIDGASNRGIDDARRLKEDIGYAPVECRYKVFIIDEAHMLTKEAFNALLKTLEEPPPRATFIMATTEHHKFPATIISRCQHYTFKMLPQQELVDHLEKIMNLEELQYEPGALQIIAKRGAGSVRDSMSLLGQALAMGTDVLREEDVRGFLGLAGQDVFFQLMEAMHSRNLVSVGMVLRQVLDQGLDLGFFLRELTNCWRNMFLLRQAGEEALSLLGFSGEEATTWMEWAGKFDPAHIHACWQMTLDGQKKVMISLEPALALELLLLNLTSLPDLISLESVGSNAPSGNSAPQRPTPQGGGQYGGPQGGAAPGRPGGAPGGGYSPPGGQRFAPPPPASPQSSPPQAAQSQPAPSQAVPPQAAPSQSVQPSAPPVREMVPPQTPPSQPVNAPSVQTPPPASAQPPVHQAPPERLTAPPVVPPSQSAPPVREMVPPQTPPSQPVNAPSVQTPPPASAQPPVHQAPPERLTAPPVVPPSQSAPPVRESAPLSAPEPVAPSEATPVAEAVVTQPEAVAPPQTHVSPGPRNWNGFMDFVAERNGQSGINSTRLRLNTGEIKDNELLVTCASKMQCEYLTEKKVNFVLDNLVREYFGPTVEVRVETGDIAVRKSDRQLQEEAESNPAVRKVMDMFSAQLGPVSSRE